MSSVTLLDAVAADNGTGPAVDIAAATSLRLTWDFSFGAPEQVSGFFGWLEHAPGSGGPWVHLGHTPLLYSAGSYRFCVGGADQYVRGCWFASKRGGSGGASPGLTVSLAGEAL